MKRKLLFPLLIAAAFCAVPAFFESALSAFFSTALAFPFEQLALGLGALSRTGRGGLILAWALLLGVSAVPILLAEAHPASERRAENAMLYFISPALFVTIFGMLRPALFQNPMTAGSEAMRGVVNGALGCSFYALAAAYLIARILRLFREGDRARLISCGKYMLCALCFIFVASAAYGGTAALLAGLAASLGTADRVFSVLRAAVYALPYALDVAVALSALELFERLAEGESAETVAAAERLSRLCGAALLISVAATALFNYLQLLFAKSLGSLSATVRIPVFSLAFVLFAALLARLIEENRRLADDNGLFI